jgi:hypothetical protein
MDTTALINAAFVLLGQPAMASAGAPVSRVQREAVANADGVRRELLAKQRWTSGLRRGVVDHDSAIALPLGFTRIGNLPEDFLALWQTGPDHFTLMAQKRIAWSGESRIGIEYAADVAYEALDPLLQHALATRLAHRICKAVTDRATDFEVYAKMATQAEIDAASRDALNRRETPLLTSNWLTGGIAGQGQNRRPDWMG